MDFQEQRERRRLLRQQARLQKKRPHGSRTTSAGDNRTTARLLQRQTLCGQSHGYLPGMSPIATDERL